jgi:hypothetical protein
MTDEEKKDTQEEETGTVSLVSQEGDSFDVPMGVARMSELVKTMIDGNPRRALIEISFDGF